MEHDVSCYYCEQCSDKFDFLCDFQNHIQEHSESGRQYVHISICGKFPRKEVKKAFESMDNVSSVEYPDIDSWVSREERGISDGYAPCDICKAWYDVVYMVEHCTRQCFKHK